jgi:hypothetical protein
MTLNSDFFVSEVEFLSLPQPLPRDRSVTRQFRLDVAGLGRSFATVTVLFLNPQAVGASEAWIVPSVILRSQPSQELTPEVVALYREAANEDRELAEAGIADFDRLLKNSDET